MRSQDKGPRRQQPQDRAGRGEPLGRALAPTSWVPGASWGTGLTVAECHTPTSQVRGVWLGEAAALVGRQPGAAGDHLPAQSKSLQQPEPVKSWGVRPTSGDLKARIQLYLTPRGIFSVI